jgi:acid phosphatase class B
MGKEKRSLFSAQVFYHIFSCFATDYLKKFTFYSKMNRDLERILEGF